MAQWGVFDDLVADLLSEFKAAKDSGATDEAAITRAAARLAVHRDDIANPKLSYGLTVAVLRSVADVMDHGGARH